MSYCRFSSDNFWSDVYVYESCMGGFTTHVAGNRVVGDVPKIIPLIGDTNEAYIHRDISQYVKSHSEQAAFLNDAERLPICLPHAGETLHDDTALECAARLEYLQCLGYRVPQYAIDALKEEGKEEDKDD